MGTLVRGKDITVIDLTDKIHEIDTRVSSITVASTPVDIDKPEETPDL